MSAAVPSNCYDALSKSAFALMKKKRNGIQFLQMNSSQLVWQKYALEWQGYAIHDFSFISKLSFACNRDRLNSNAKLLGPQVLQAGTTGPNQAVYFITFINISLL